jgi:hypothetical protein
MSGAAAAAAAAARRRRLLEQGEEEEMTNYASEELANDWEFKIVRANTTAFRSPRAFNRLLEHEAQAGWTMVEKFDDMRVRFKRPRQARLRDAQLPPGVDPYGSHYGMSTAAFSVVTLLLALGLVGGMIALILYLVH